MAILLGHTFASLCFSSLLHHCPPIQTHSLSPTPSLSLCPFQTHAVGGSKSLVDDEAELSDWVRELRTDSNRHGGGRGVESDGNPRGRVKDRGRDRDREAYPAKRSRRDSSGSGYEFGESRTRGGFRSSRSNLSSLSKRGDRGGRAVDSGFRRGSATGGGRDVMKAMRVVDDSEDDEVNEKIEGPKPKQRNEQ